MVGTTCYSFQTSKRIIVAVFFTPLIFGDGPVFSDSYIFGGLYSRSKRSTFSETSGREVSHGSILDICFFEEIRSDGKKKKK